jgi:anti-sigma regulatory factor (Ser/Thr protein kinase)/GNAT superfamily N-acetyltransferase
MPAPVRTELTLPAAPAMLPLVQDHVRSLGSIAGLPGDQGEALALAVREACKNSLDRAGEEDETSVFKLTGELTPAALTLSLFDRGLPFSETLEPEAPLPDPESASTPAFPGGSLAAIQHGADEVRWINHGVEGNELRLTKYLAGVCRLESPGDKPPVPRPGTIQPGAAGDYAIRLLSPGDARSIAQLMYRVYGYTYSNVDFYYPDRLAHDLETGRHLGVVAVAGDGEIVGHVGVERPDLGPLAELGQLAVAPAHRGQGLRKRMGDRLQAEIRRLGLIGLFAEAVTIHTVSQQGSDSRGLFPTGIKLLDWQAHFKRLQYLYQGDTGTEEAPQRESLVFYFQYLSHPGAKAVCAPSRHREMLGKIYGNLKVELHFLEPSGATGPGRLAVHYDQTTGAGSIQVNRIGIDTLPAIYQARRDLCHMAGAKVVGLYLPLAQGGTPFLCEAAEAEGFFLSGVQPEFAGDGDFLRLQYLNAPLDLERLHLSSPFARELLEYILQERERLNQDLVRRDGQEKDSQGG